MTSLNKAAIIERCLARVREVHAGDDANPLDDPTRQDSILLNLQRACEASIDLSTYVVRKRRLGLPQESREAFDLMERAGLLAPELARHALDGRMQERRGSQLSRDRSRDRSCHRSRAPVGLRAVHLARPAATLPLSDGDAQVAGVDRELQDHEIADVALGGAGHRTARLDLARDHWIGDEARGPVINV